MDSMVFKYKQHHQYQQQSNQQHFTSRSSNYHNNTNSSSNNHNNNQNSIFILNTATNNILPNNPKLYYADLNDNNNVPTSSSTSSSSSSSSSSTSTTASSSSSSSVWSSASSTMCSPAANAIQKLFNCSSNSLKLNHGNYSGIDAKPFKSKSELLKKKTKFWKYLEGEANDKNNQQGIEEGGEGNLKKREGKSLKKYKSKYWSKSGDSENQNPSDLSELLEYSCSLCDNCRCMDCQIGYFDCENSDDSNSEYSFHLSAYEEDEHIEAAVNDKVPGSENERGVMELKTHNCLQESDDDCCKKVDNNQEHFNHKLQIDSQLSTAYCVCNELDCLKVQCCQQCWQENLESEEPNYLTNQRDH